MADRAARAVAMGTGTRSSAICVLCAAFAGCARVDEAAAVRACFDGYKRALLDQDGKKALSFVDRNTLDYYSKVRDSALRADRRAVGALSTMDKLIVLMIRHCMSSESLEPMTEEALFVHAVEEGWVGKESAASNELGEIAVSGTRATGVHVWEGEETPIKWVFRKEDGRWRIDLTAILPVGDQAMKQVIRESGLPEDEFLTSLLESVSGRKVADRVWEPMTR